MRGTTELGTRVPGFRPLGVQRSPSPRPWLLSSLPSLFGSSSRRARTWGRAERAEGPGRLAGGYGGCGKAGEGTQSGNSVGGRRTTGTAARDPRWPPPLPSRSEPEHPMTLPIPVLLTPSSKCTRAPSIPPLCCFLCLPAGLPSGYPDTHRVPRLPAPT